MKKCAKVKNPCRICFQPVTAKNGLRCLGACKKWAHFKCLDYTPGKIQDIKAGLIKVNCPCPDCDNEFKEVQTNKPYNCNKEECPANEELICESDSCPKKLCSDKSTDYVFNCPDDCPSPEGSGDEGKKTKDSCPPTCLPPKQCPSPSCPPPPCPPPACPPSPCKPPPCPSPPPSCPPKRYCEPPPPPCPPKRCSPPRASSPKQCPPPKCPRPKSPPCPRRKSPSCLPPPCPRPKSPPCSPSPCPPAPCPPPPCPPSKCLVQKVYSGFENPSDISLHMRGSNQSVVSYCQGSPAQIPIKPNQRSSSPKGNKKQSCPKPNRPIPCSHECCPSNQCPPKPCPPRTKTPKNPKSCLDELQNECNTNKCKMLDMQAPRRATRQPSYLTGSRSSCSGLNTEEPTQNRCMSDPSLTADPRKLLLSTMNQMCNTVGEFQIQFKELMSKMMNALDEAS